MKSYHDITGDGGSNVVGQVTAQQDRLARRLASVRNIVAVMSGKGGVGKSAMTVQLAAALVGAGERVGILDADINGASIARMTGTLGTGMESRPDGMEPPVSSVGVRVVSIDMMLGDATRPVTWDATTQHDAYAWRGLMEMGAIREFLSDTRWGALDYLMIDLPPGTDKLPNIVDVLPRITGTVVVTLPSVASQLVVEKSIRMATEMMSTPVIGVVENMASHVCSACGHEDALFPGDDVRRLAERHALAYLGAIPFDARLAAADEVGRFMLDHGDSPAGRAITDVAAAIRTFSERGPGGDA